MKWAARAWPALAIIMLALPAAAHAELGAVEAGQIETAIAQGRLHQAELMVASHRVAGAADSRLDALEADLLLAQHKHEAALAIYLKLAAAAPEEAHFWTGAGIASLQLRRLDDAMAQLRRAAALPGADWKTWNALGVLSDHRRAWQASEEAYGRALALAPASPVALNNRGYSLLLQKRFGEALDLLRRAAALEPENQRIALNLKLAAAMSGDYSLRRGPRESAQAWARRLNNAGYAAWLAGDRAAARSLLARAIEASEIHYSRAAENLKLVEAAGPR